MPKKIPAPLFSFLVSCLSITCVVIVWWLLARKVNSNIILANPFEVFRALVNLLMYNLASPDNFYQYLLASFLRGLFAFTVSALLGIFLGVLAARSQFLASFLHPLLTIIRAAPILALILVLLLWSPSDIVPVIAAFLMCFPVMYNSALAGAQALDTRLLAMAQVFALSGQRIFWELRLPSMMPFLLAGARASLGLAWKVTVAAEVLAQPLHALGTGLQNARLALDGAGVLAWAVAAILLCGFTEILFWLIYKAARLSRFEANAQ